MKVHFSTFAVAGVLENGLPLGDYVALSDGHGVERDVLTEIRDGDVWARSVRGDTVTITLHADTQTTAAGLVIDRYGYGTVPLYPDASLLPRPESLCGTDEKRSLCHCQAVVPDRIRLSDPVASLLVVNDCGGISFCSGFLMSSDGQLMTHAHCANSNAEAKSMEAWFNYNDDAAGAGPCSLANRSNPDIFRVKQLLQAECDLDVAVHLIDDPGKGNPAEHYGYLPLSPRAPVNGEAVWVPQQPLGLQKALSEVHAAIASPALTGFNFCADPPGACANPGAPTTLTSDFGHTADIEGGSSGSPILDAANHVIGLHRAGGCIGATGENLGVRIAAHLRCAGA